MTQFQRPAKAQAGKKEDFSDHHDQPCMPLASTSGHCRAAQDDGWKGLEAQKEPGIQGTALLWYPFVLSAVPTIISLV